ncbi:MAG: 30S ribosomal protein S16 [Candidatus Ancillula sp.]|nr:30S ribosomal protein S16 [Candidatus Ancillula sp.]
MATKMRLKRFGKKRAPFYRVVIMDSRKARDGKAVEEIGLYHPTREPSVIEINSERAQYWLSVGAQPTQTVQRLLELTGDWGKFKGDPNAKSTVKPQPAKLTPEEKIAKAADEAEKLKQAKAKANEEAKAKAVEEARKAEEDAKAAKEAEAAASAEEATTEEAPADAPADEATPSEESATDAPAEESADTTTEGDAA